MGSRTLVESLPTNGTVTWLDLARFDLRASVSAPLESYFAEVWAVNSDESHQLYVESCDSKEAAFQLAQDITRAITDLSLESSLIDQECIQTIIVAENGKSFLLHERNWTTVSRYSGGQFLVLRRTDTRGNINESDQILTEGNEAYIERCWDWLNGNHKENQRTSPPYSDLRAIALTDQCPAAEVA